MILRRWRKAAADNGKRSGREAHIILQKATSKCSPVRMDCTQHPRTACAAL